LNSGVNFLLFLFAMNSSWRIFAPSGVSTKPGEDHFLYSLPSSAVGERAFDTTAVPEDVRREYYEKVEALMALAEPASEDADEIVPMVIQFSEEAQECMRGYYESLEPRLGRAGDLSSLGGWAKKLAGTVARLATLLHVCEYGAIPVGAGAVDAATILGEYFLAHAQAAFGLIAADPSVAVAERILAWVREKGARQFNRRDLHRALRSNQVKRAEDLDPALRLLEEHGYIRKRPAPPEPGAGRPSIVFDTNPRTLGHSDETAKTPGSGGSLQP
jgi:hypothetical protein